MKNCSHDRACMHACMAVRSARECGFHAPLDKAAIVAIDRPLLISVERGRPTQKKARSEERAVAT